MGAMEPRLPFWTVAQTQVGREPFALDHLERAGFEVYLPRIKVRDRSRERTRAVALFPSYLFVHVAERWQPICRTVGVTRLLLNGEQPARLPEAVLAEIKAREGKSGFVRLPPALRPGQKVEILRGSFQGHVAIYQGQSARERGRVLLELLGRQVGVNIHADDLEPLPLARRNVPLYKSAP